MSRALLRTFCLVPSTWTLEDLAKAPPCHMPGSHAHLNLRELYGEVALVDLRRDPRSSRIAQSETGHGGQLDLGLVDWLSYPKVLRVAYQPAVLTGAQVRGLSARVGEYLAAALRRHEPWAEIMLIDLRHQVILGRRLELDPEWQREHDALIHGSPAN